MAGGNQTRYMWRFLQVPSQRYVANICQILSDLNYDRISLPYKLLEIYFLDFDSSTIEMACRWMFVKNLVALKRTI